MKQEKLISRKHFLHLSAAAIIAGLLSACGNQSETSKKESPLTMPTQIVPEPAVASDPAYMAVARGEGENEPVLVDALVRRAIAELGGMQRFISKNDSVIIKPNICTAYYSYEYAATTNPFVVGTLVKLAFEAGAKKVQVFDSPFGGTASKAYSISGIDKQVQEAGGEMVVMSGLKYVDTELPKGIDIKKWQIYEDVLNADVFIDVPIAKHHSLSQLTLGMKNLMGVILDRNGFHRNLGQRLADLTSKIMPALTVIDATRMLMANGPTGGNLNDVRRANTIIACPDIVAADSYGATLFGMEPEDISYIKAATEMGLGRSDLKNMEIREITI